MTYNTNTNFLQESVKESGTQPIEMFCLNASLSGWNPLYYANYNQDIYGWSVDNSTGGLTTTATVYVGLPIKTGTVKSDVSGEVTAVEVSIPNTDRVIESVIQNNDYLRGREVYFILTFAKYLPSGSTYKYIGSEPDKNAVLVEKFYVDGVSSNEQVVTFTCKPKFSLKNMIIPRRTFTRQCSWALMGRYRGIECDPDGNIDGETYPTCDGTLKSCRERGNESRFGGFPSIPRKYITI